MAKYFDKFPLVEYNGSLVKNILAKIDFTQKTRDDIHSNFDYVLSERNKRPDNLSTKYYNSPFYDWLIYISNNVIDPYHDFYKSEQEMSDFIISKYGSIRNAQSLVLYYRNNWAPDDGNISVSVFDKLGSNIQQYYKPVVSNNNQVLNYVRKQEDWIQSTNKIQLLIMKNTEFFSVGETINQNGTIANIVTVNDDSLVVNHVRGEFTSDSNIIEVRTLTQNISDLEAPFWAPVTAYDEEYEKNELKRYINIIKSSYIPDIEKQFNELLR